MGFAAVAISARWARLERHMDIWRQWQIEKRERGWPTMSVEGRALEAGSRPQPGPRIPDIDRARIGPWVDRLLCELGERGEGGKLSEQVLRAVYGTDAPQWKLANQMGIKYRTFKRTLNRAKEELDLMLDSTPRR